VVDQHRPRIVDPHPLLDRATGLLVDQPLQFALGLARVSPIRVPVARLPPILRLIFLSPVRQRPYQVSRPRAPLTT